VSGGEAPILADDSGRRRQRLRVLGRVLSGLLILWLGVLGLGALGLQPLGGLPVLGLTPDRATPSELPARIQAAVRTHRVVSFSSAVRGLLPADAPGAAARSPSSSVRQGGPATGRPPKSRATPRGSGGVLPDTRTSPVGPATPGGSGPAPAQRTPVAPGRSGTTPARPVPPGRSGTTPAPATPGRPEQPGRSEATPTQPAPPAHGAPTDPRSIGTGPPVTTPPS
jgi:hypothetical protein